MSRRRAKQPGAERCRPSPAGRRADIQALEARQGLKHVRGQRAAVSHPLIAVGGKRCVRRRVPDAAKEHSAPSSARTYTKRKLSAPGAIALRYSGVSVRLTQSAAAGAAAKAARRRGRRNRKRRGRATRQTAGARIPTRRPGVCCRSAARGCALEREGRKGGRGGEREKRERRTKGKREKRR